MDQLSIKMQEAIIDLAEQKTGRPLRKELLDNIKTRGWSYMGLEMIFDTVKTLDDYAIEDYLRAL
jgi:hypothetical protein